MEKTQQKYYSVVTDIGTAVIANSAVLGEKVNITAFAVGDGGGAYYQPTTAMTVLKREKWRGNIQSFAMDEISSNVAVVTAILPSNIGGFTIREMGFFDDKNRLIGLCNTPDMEKVAVIDGVSSEMELTIKIAVSNQNALQFVADPTVIIVTAKDLERHNLSVKSHEVQFALKANADLSNVEPEILKNAIENAGVSTETIDCGLFTDPALLSLTGRFLAGEYCVGQLDAVKNQMLETNTVQAGGTVWIDNVTPVNASNMNKIESKLTELENTKVTQGNIHLNADEF